MILVVQASNSKPAIPVEKPWKPAPQWANAIALNDSSPSP
jgi:hypothetical protein